MPNRLAQETSPYLLQHKENPVDWYPWGEEALSRAKDQDKPILLSIGYSACHWCHVMERESFENKEIAAQLNRNFVSIKVDREERPDIDSIYMSAVQALSGHGGWPLTVFLMPDGKPFYGGTYFPPMDRGAMPGFPNVLSAVSAAYQNQKLDLEENTERLLGKIRQMTLGSSSEEIITEADLRSAYLNLAAQSDMNLGGLSGSPKFPQPMIYEFLLRHYVRTGDPESLEIVTTTLDAMADGGIYDQIGGGFHRYSTDADWLVPHFEKMLYDNALLIRLYLHGYQVTQDERYRQIADETLRYCLREMATSDGAFYSAQDADSEGEEGKFFAWTLEELRELLGGEDGNRIGAYFGVTRKGDFEGGSVLKIAESLRTDLDKKDGSNVRQFVASSKERLYNARCKRIPPETDDKILTAWNGLLIAALAEASAVLSNPEYADAASKCANFVLTKLRVEGRLLRTTKDGVAKLNGYLEDYAFLAEGLLALHEATLEPRWLIEAITLGKDMIDLFWDRATGQFYDTGSDHEQLVVRPRDLSDNAIPSGSSAACMVLLRLAIYTGDSEIQELAKKSLRSARELMVRVPAGAGHWLSALDFHLSTPREIVITGDPSSESTQTLLTQVYRNYLPNRVVLGCNGNPTLAELPLAKDRESLDSKATAYVCQNYTCQMPTTDPVVLAQQLVG